MGKKMFNVLTSNFIISGTYPFSQSVSLNQRQFKLLYFQSWAMTGLRANLINQ